MDVVIIVEGFAARIDHSTDTWAVITSIMVAAFTTTTTAITVVMA